MKKQKMLRMLSDSSALGHLGDLEEFIKEKIEIEKRIISSEEDLGHYIATLIRKRPGYNNFKRLLSLQVEGKIENGEKTTNKKLIEQISLQIAESMNRYYDITEDYNIAYINWGQKSYTIVHSDVWRIFHKQTINLKEEFDELNIFLKQFDVNIFFPGEVLINPGFSQWPVGIFIRIFNP